MVVATTSTLTLATTLFPPASGTTSSLLALATICGGATKETTRSTSLPALTRVGVARVTIALFGLARALRCCSVTKVPIRW